MSAQKSTGSGASKTVLSEAFFNKADFAHWCEVFAAVEMLESSRCSS